ncbi:hypothetical protein SS50377_25272 [Spironucleus salmonicida]|uniref:Uncharacterized protein n=1 Tax=Spironucleus salmonicida TaxID=348837 RepID=V6LBP1_9EUKA|nr:hypothetical protein SS50377_25272 [Spironucleus salmonicida]|eukprot:EST41847.1 Hypothetical protein SS50377_18682 [Spironucleus salmonicida]
MQIEQNQEFACISKQYSQIISPLPSMDQQKQKQKQILKSPPKIHLNFGSDNDYNPTISCNYDNLRRGTPRLPKFQQLQKQPQVLQDVQLQKQITQLFIDKQDYQDMIEEKDNNQIINKQLLTVFNNLLDENLEFYI